MKHKASLAAVISTLLLCSSLAGAQAPEGADQALAEGWRLFNIGMYQEACENFQVAFKAPSLKENAGQGLAYSLMKQGKLEEALKVAESFPPENDVFRGIRRDITSQMALGAFESKDYPKAEIYFRKLIEMGEKDSSWKSLLGWSLFHQGKEEKAAPLFQEAYRQDKNHKSAEAAFLAFGRSGDFGGGLAFIESLDDSVDPETLKKAGHFLYNAGMPITAAQRDKAPDRPYVNAHKPRIQAEGILRTKTGDEGTSKLTDISIPITYSHPFYTGKELSFSLIPVMLDSGNAPSSPMVGSYYKKGSVNPYELNTKLTALVPKITYICEGKPDYLIQAGTTPIEGEVGPAPTFLFRARGGGFNFSAYQSPVTESILSYTGLLDPYSEEHWGRTLRTGAAGELSFTFLGPHWFSIAAAYNKYSGEGVADNNEINATVSTGRAFSTEDLSIAAGIFGYAAQFDMNSNFFTLGHGGYFSPQDFKLAGLMLSIETQPVDDFWGELKLSLSYMNFTTEESPMYPTLDDPALNGKVYPGETISQLGYSGSVRAYKLFTDHWMAGAGMTLNKASDYTENIVFVMLRYHFGMRKAVLFVKDQVYR